MYCSLSNDPNTPMLSNCQGVGIPISAFFDSMGQSYRPLHPNGFPGFYSPLQASWVTSIPNMTDTLSPESKVKVATALGLEPNYLGSAEDAIGMLDSGLGYVNYMAAMKKHGEITVQAVRPDGVEVTAVWSSFPATVDSTPNLYHMSVSTKSPLGDHGNLHSVSRAVIDAWEMSASPYLACSKDQAFEMANKVMPTATVCGIGPIPDLTYYYLKPGTLTRGPYVGACHCDSGCGAASHKPLCSLPKAGISTSSCAPPSNGMPW